MKNRLFGYIIHAELKVHVKIEREVENDDSDHAFFPLKEERN
jgi:hypothetical protein